MHQDFAVLCNSDFTDDDSYIRFVDAANLLAVSKGTVSKWANSGKLADNGKKGKGRKVSKVSVLLVKQEREDEDVPADAKELRRDSMRL